MGSGWSQGGVKVKFKVKSVWSQGGVCPESRWNWFVVKAKSV